MIKYKSYSDCYNEAYRMYLAGKIHENEITEYVHILYNKHNKKDDSK